MRKILQDLCAFFFCPTASLGLLFFTHPRQYKDFRFRCLRGGVFVAYGRFEFCYDDFDFRHKGEVDRKKKYAHLVSVVKSGVGIRLRLQEDVVIESIVEGLRELIVSGDREVQQWLDDIEAEKA